MHNSRSAHSWANIQLQRIRWEKSTSQQAQTLKADSMDIYKTENNLHAAAAHYWIDINTLELRICQRHNENLLIWHQKVSEDDCASNGMTTRQTRRQRGVGRESVRCGCITSSIPEPDAFQDEKLLLLCTLEPLGST